MDISSSAKEYIKSLSDPKIISEFPGHQQLDEWSALQSFLEAQALEQRVAWSEGAALELISREFDVDYHGRRLKVPVLEVTAKPDCYDQPMLIHLHGGAYTFYSVHSSLVASGQLAQATGYRVLSINYSLAPQANWKQIRVEILSVIRQLIAEGHELGKMAICGESAGASLAAATVLALRDSGHGLPAACLLRSPWSDISDTGLSYKCMADDEPFYRYDKHLARCARAYAEPKDYQHPWVSPVYGDYRSGFCPTLIQGGSREIFLSNFIRHYQAINQASPGGSPLARLDLYEGMVHVFQLESQLPESKIAMEVAANFLHQYLAVGQK